MSIERKCENCNAEYNDFEYCHKCKYNAFKINEDYNFDLFTPNEKAVRQDERNKIITLLKSDLENYDGLADDCFESNCLSRKDEMIECIAISKYIKNTIELLEKED